MLVSNTSTLILLAKIGLLEKFVEISPVIEIPSQVKAEALFEKGSYDARLIMKLISNKKIIVREIENRKAKVLQREFRLHEGEAAAYLLFDQKKHKALLTDDGELIKLSKLEGVPFICAMAIVIMMYERRMLLEKEALEKLSDLKRIGRYSTEIYQYFISEVR